MFWTVFHIMLVLWMVAVSALTLHHIALDQQRIESVIERIEHQDARLGDVLERIDVTLNKILELARESQL